MKTLTRQADDTHRVVCSRCDLWMVFRDVRRAIDEYVGHSCSDDKDES